MNDCLAMYIERDIACKINKIYIYYTMIWKYETS